MTTEQSDIVNIEKIRAMEKEILNSYPETDGFSLKRDTRRKKPVMNMKLREQVPFLCFPKLSACSQVEHLFTTRLGGVSEGQFWSMNFSSKLGDQRERVLENFHRIAGVMDCRVEDMVGTVQTHTTNIFRVKEEDRGKGILRDPELWELDGLVTDVRGITLVAYMADCVPLFFVDPLKNAVGIAHSGWRGTVQNMAGKMVERFRVEFDSRPEDLVVGIGPSICQDCYEVDEAVAASFLNALGADDEERIRIAQSGIYPMNALGEGDTEKLRSVVESGKAEGKYQLDLHLANLIFLVRAGVRPENIDVTDICTAENSRILFSHRASGGKRGNMGAFIKLK